MLKLCLRLWIFCLISVCHAGSAPLPADQAFMFSAKVSDNNKLFLQWKIAPNYYLYRERLGVEPLQNNAIPLGAITLPTPQTKRDAQGVYQVYTGVLNITAPLLSEKGLLALEVKYQGCSEQGFCYPPMKRTIELPLSSIKGRDLTSYFVPSVKKNSISRQEFANQILEGQHVYMVVVIFLFLGLLLAFTPCVLPMVPILSSIIINQANHLNTKKAFLLSLSYVLGMSLAYAAAGVMIALMGSSVQVALQQPWVIVLFSGLFVLLALSLFGMYDIRMPNKLHHKIATYNRRHQGGTYAGVFLMGIFSTLIISPCVSAPLVGALAYIANSGDIWLGGLALFSLGLGMGLPVLLIGASAGKLLPKTGAWMNKIKKLFGFLMLALAIWMLERILSDTVTMLLQAILLCSLAVFFWKLTHTKKLWRHVNKGLGLLVLCYGILLMAGAITSKTDLLQIFSGKPTVSSAMFSVVKNMDELDNQLARAKQEQKQVMLDFYADWCASCIIMDKHVFAQPAVKEALAKFILLRADVTHNTAFDKALLKRFQVIAPPTMVFFNEKGIELSQQKVVGEISSKELLSDISQMHNEKQLLYCQNKAQSC